MNKFLEITSLTENVTYPDGYNVVEILGTGDERPASFDEPTGPGSRPTSGRTLDLEPVDSSVVWQGSTVVIVVGTEDGGEGGTGSVDFNVAYGIGTISPATVVLGTKSFTGVSVSLSGHNTFSLPYPGFSVSDIVFLGQHYTVLSITDGTTVTIDGTFGVTTGTATVDYTACGYAETTYTAPPTDVTGEAYIVGTWSDASPTTAVITITEDGTGHAGSLSLDAEETSLPYAATTRLIITGDENVPAGSIVNLEASDGIVEASVALGDMGFPNAVGRISGKNTFTVDYQIKSVSHITNVLSLQASYAVVAIEGNTAYVAGEFPYVQGEVTCSYTATNIAEAFFTAPSATTKCMIQASSDVANPAAVEIEVSAEGEPNGYNWVNRPVFPTLQISGPLTMSSNGVDVATLVVQIYDPNSTNPFLLQRGMFESASPSGPQDFTTEYWITEISGCWEDETKTLPIPLAYLSYRNNEVHISDDFTADGAPAGWKGLYRPEVYIEYTGFITMSVEDGQQVSDRWWERPGDDEGRTERDVSGLLFVDEAATIVNDNSEVPIVSATGQNTTVKFYYRPDAGEEGIAYINAEYGGRSVTWPISVTCGSFVGASISMNAEPSTIPPNGKALLTFEASDSNGGALYGDADNPIVVNFFVQKGQGSINPASAELQRKVGFEEEVESDSDTTFSVSNPIVRITALSVIGNGTFVWNGEAVVSGNSVTLVDQTFPLATCPLAVTYDWGGAARVYYYAYGDVDKDVVYVGGRIDSKANTLCRINIDAENGGRDTSVDLSINAADGTIAKGGTTAVTATAYKDGVPITKDVVFTLVPERGSIKMSYDSTPIVEEECSISDRKTTSTNYLPVSVTEVKFMGDVYAVESQDGSTITLAGDGFPVASGTCLVSYTPSGLWSGTFTGANADYTAHLNIVAEEELRTDVVTVGSGDDGPEPVDPPEDPEAPVGGPDLTISAEPKEISRGEMSVIKAEVKFDGRPQSGERIKFKVISGPGSMLAEESYSGGDGGAEGILSTSETGPIGTATINVTWGGITKTEEVSVTAVTGGEVKIEDLPEILLNGTIDPATKEVVLTGSAVMKSIGAARYADDFGCLAEDPVSLGPEALIEIQYTNNTDLGWFITDVVVTGAICEPGKDTAGKFAYNNLTLRFPWIYGPNVAREQVVHVVDKLDETQPIVGATVTAGGMSAITDQSGTAKFIGIAPGTYQIGITHPNYKDNRAGVSGGTGVYDSDLTNDSYTVKPYSSRQWILDKLAFSIKIQYKGYQPSSRGSTS